ncbi:MAG: hypothetical protein US94_C0016G0003 [Berkelbacteria bacterium GW2011_GWB1_38_5]|uniref:Cardiolipin synthase N-terminal domain-containing protein n=1 Tax=Berkelbacteria bacterium GW2011_GWB1_38_5 TaxID=1618336 RepID=A0A0G0NA80_9BACT|nr:MAG: hypothetical protein US94_C0016G0003 [Berkelbacteria bacterium GW2011_GWB1_38_5]
MDYTPYAADVAANTAAVGLGIGMILFWVLFVGVGGVIWIWALIDVIRRQFANQNDKTLWLIIVILLGWIGGLVYLIAGRKKGTIPASK